MWYTSLSLALARSVCLSVSLSLSLPHTQTAEMDGQYAAFGKVVSGIELLANLNPNKQRMLTYADVCWHILTYADVC